MGFVVTTQFLEHTPAAERARSLRHTSCKADDPPEPEVTAQDDTARLLHGIDSAAGTLGVGHLLRNGQQEIRGNERVRVKEDQNVVRRGSRPGVPHPGDVVLRLTNDADAGGLCDLGRPVSAAVVDEGDFDRHSGAGSEVTFRCTEPIEGPGKVTGLIEGRDDHGHGRGVQRARFWSPVPSSPAHHAVVSLGRSNFLYHDRTITPVLLHVGSCLAACPSRDGAHYTAR